MMEKENKQCCPHCENTKVSLKYRKIDNPDILPGFDDNSHLNKCMSCGSLYMDHKPDFDELFTIYNQYFEYPTDYSPKTIASYKRRLKKIEKHLSTLPPRLLEIGCAGGNWLYAAKELGWEVEGNDLNQEMLDKVKSKIGVRVHHGFFETINFGERHFDVIIAINVFEHLRDHKSFIKKLSEVIAPGGLFLMKTPIADSWAERLEGADWIHLKELGHIMFGTRKSITKDFEKCGFQLKKYENAGFPPRLSFLLSSDGDASQNLVVSAPADEQPGNKKKVYSLEKRAIRRYFSNINAIKPLYFYILNLLNIGDSAYFLFIKK